VLLTVWALTRFFCPEAGGRARNCLTWHPTGDDIDQNIVNKNGSMFMQFLPAPTCLLHMNLSRNAEFSCGSRVPGSVPSQGIPLDSHASDAQTTPQMCNQFLHLLYSIFTAAVLPCGHRAGALAGVLAGSAA
jgi:hypothetical protein